MESQTFKEETEQDKFKILWSSNATFAPTGYGVQTEACSYRLKNAGFNIRVAANYGLDGAALGFNNILQYPHLFGQFGEDALQIIMDNWKPDVFITLYDVWIGGLDSSLGKDWFRKLHDRWVCWLPIDQNPISDPVAHQASMAYKRVAMSKYGQQQLKNIGLDSTFIPHGVNTQVFKPYGDKREHKKWLELHSTPIVLEPKRAKIDEDSFVVGVNMANKDPIRKDWGRTLTAFQIFLNDNPDAKKDARLHLHTWIQFPGGMNLQHLAQKLGITDYVKFTKIYYMYCSLPPQAMAQLYNSFDVLMNVSRGEGFGVPILEAEACGVPVIATDFSAMTELVGDHGWLIPPYARDVECPKCKEHFSYGCKDGARAFDHLISTYAIPDEWKVAEALTDAYNHPGKRADLGEKARVFAQNYDFDRNVVPAWIDVLNEVKSELGMFGNPKAKDEAFEKLFAEVPT